MYQGLLKEIGLMLNYQAISNIMGNSFAGEDGIEAVNRSNPMMHVEEEEMKRVTMRDLMSSPLMNNNN
jgi:hypothetical protein